MIQIYNNYSNNSNAVPYNLIISKPAGAMGTPPQTPMAIRIKIMPVIDNEMKWQKKGLEITNN
jgi:hypothetical protein